MFYYIIDDDEVFRSMLSQIIEDEDLGEVVGEAEDGALVEVGQLNFKKVDILFIDLLMPIRDGIETVRQIAPSFTGKIIMISQVESKQLIGEAYSLGVEYYITKPLNKIEVVSVVRKVMERIRLERSIQDIQKSLNNVFQWEQPKVRSEPLLEEKKLLILDGFYYRSLELLERMEVKIYLVCWNIYQSRKRQKLSNMDFQL